MNHLPAEVIESILSSLDLSELITVSHVCSRFREIVAKRHFQNYLINQVDRFLSSVIQRSNVVLGMEYFKTAENVRLDGIMSG